MSFPLPWHLARCTVGQKSLMALSNLLVITRICNTGISLAFFDGVDGKINGIKIRKDEKKAKNKFLQRRRDGKVLLGSCRRPLTFLIHSAFLLYTI